MVNPDCCSHLSGSEVVREWFGAWPSFHDAEVISLALSRRGESVLLVYPYFPENPATVEFRLAEITNLELAGFSCQNVISDLMIERTTNAHSEEVYRLTLHPCFGVTGSIEAKQLHVNLIPGKSPDAGSLW
jgi:hypothetical protein